MDALKRKRILAKMRFKAIVRLVIANLPWLREVGTGEGVRTKMLVFATTHQTKSSLPLEYKALLNKPAEDRTEEEKFLLYRVIGRFSFFRKYPENVKMLLASCTYFLYYGPDRVIVREGQVTQALYFIIEGNVSVTQTVWDQFSQRNEHKFIATIKKGETFGEGSLLYNEPCRHTITSLTPVELLVVRKNDFDVVLKDTVKSGWDRILDALAGFTYFDSWDESLKKDCGIVGRIRQFKKNETILGDGIGAHWVYFVLKGKCSMIEHLTFNNENYFTMSKRPDERERKSEARESLATDTRKSYSSKVKMAARSSNLKSKNDVRSSSQIDEDDPEAILGTIKSTFMSYKTVVKFMQVCIFSTKAVFGIGERMVRRRIVALTDVECLAIPRYWLQMTGDQNTWIRIRRFLEQNIPSSEELLRQYNEEQKWRKYTEDLVKSQVRKLPCNCPQNVPYSIRIKRDYAFNSRTMTL